MPAESSTQRERVIQLLGSDRIMRLHEMVDAGIAATTVARMAKAGEIVRLGRGLYQVVDADFGGDRTGVVAKRLAVQAAPLPAGKTSLKVFDVEGHGCEDIGSIPLRSEERRVGKGWGRTVEYRWWRDS